MLRVGRHGFITQVDERGRSGSELNCAHRVVVDRQFLDGIRMRQITLATLTLFQRR
jgi:hypothetical protein